MERLEPVMKRMARSAAIRGQALIAALFVRLLFLTVRIHDCPASAAWRLGHHRPGGIFPLWHSHQLGALWHYRHLGAATIASRHRDAEAVARFARSLGYRVSRGSSTRGGAPAFLELLRWAREKRAVAITPDGPKGPRHVVKPGVVALAKQAGVPVIPLAVGYSSCWVLRSWDGFRIPRPFGVGYVLWGQPVAVAADAGPDAMEAARRNVEAQLLELEPRADAQARLLARGRRASDVMTPGATARSPSPCRSEGSSQ